MTPFQVRGFGIFFLLIILLVPLAQGGKSPLIRGVESSPDGKCVVFVETLRQEGKQDRLIVLDLDSGATKVIDPPGFMIEAWYGISWRPDGEAVVATLVEGTRMDPGDWCIWEIPVD